MKESDAIDKIARYLSGELPEREQEDLLRWANESAENRSLWEDAQRLWELSEQYEAPPYEADLTQACDQVESRLDPAAEAPARPTRRIVLYRRLSGIAAALLIGLLVVWWLRAPQPSPAGPVAAATLVQTEPGEVRELRLPDSSRVWLNGNSQLRYDPAFEPRRVELVGEAYFDIARMEDHPFEITSGEAKTVVLGTAFNVRAYPTEDKVEVTVDRGKVALVEAEQPQVAVVLSAGKTGSYDKVEKSLVEAVSPKTNAASWKNRELVYEGTPLSEVIESLERYFGVQIEVANPALLNCRLDGDYPQPQLDKILEALAFSVDLRIRREANRYLVDGPGCD